MTTSLLHSEGEQREWKKWPPFLGTEHPISLPAMKNFNSFYCFQSKCKWMDLNLWPSFQLKEINCSLNKKIFFIWFNNKMNHSRVRGSNIFGYHVFLNIFILLFFFAFSHCFYTHKRNRFWKVLQNDERIIGFRSNDGCDMCVLNSSDIIIKINVKP